MNRMQMTTTLAAAGGVTKKIAEQQLTALLSAIKESLGAGEEVTDNFKLSVDVRKARPGRNPKTGEPVAIPAKRVIKFTAYKHFRDAVAG